MFILKCAPEAVRGAETSALQKYFGARKITTSARVASWATLSAADIARTHRDLQVLLVHRFHFRVLAHPLAADITRTLCDGRSCDPSQPSVAVTIF